MNMFDKGYTFASGNGGESGNTELLPPLFDEQAQSDWLDGFYWCFCHTWDAEEIAEKLDRMIGNELLRWQLKARNGSAPKCPGPIPF